MEALTHQAVRLCVVHPTVEVHIPHQKSLTFKSVIPRVSVYGACVQINMC